MSDGERALSGARVWRHRAAPSRPLQEHVDECVKSRLGARDKYT